MTTAAALALFAVVLAWPVPRLLSAARWTHGCPRAAIVLWQAVGLAGGVSALLAAIAFTVAPLSASTPQAIASHLHNIAAGRPLSGLDWLSLIGLVLVATLAGRLFGVLTASTYATLRRRHRHRHLVDLTGREHRQASCQAGSHPRREPAAPGQAPPDRPDRPGRHHRIQDWTPLAVVRPPAAPRGGRGAAGADEPAPCELCGHVGLRILDHPVAVAYCVPGVRHARVVVSRGLLTTLEPRELRAVLAHEHAHVSGRHDLVIQPFIAWQQTFPFLRPAWEATAAVSLLVEMLADDVAARRTNGKVLARALAQLGVTRALVPAGTLGILGDAANRPKPTLAAAIQAAAGDGQTGSPARAPSTGPAAPAATSGAEDGGSAEARRAEPPSRSPVIARIVRLMEPPTVPWWQPAAAYAAAIAILATPALLLTL
ncbi:M56 family metallopeptidase [Frankia sp. CNm7]|uniref:M56 family metallopeptidase n=1 Tax=Frankia nepalensis TaxID=1836974 RepID=A0A937RPS1_9ACTN|nr:M56 family metallopeptidase [Frankia nepalensis]MBL7498411.1 M56 family metallopeptidase [Frankia nepalensis]MBL7509975.1 M56 family metallopeptidase [Frankia nepalensis]MBL7520193.1 M56 family metallopeptidase [Frankia nepalensis]MBL7629741.1 M56 family metallopeptidase [Frankia nepalensis]